MPRTIRNAGSECWAVYDDDRLVARIVPHDTGAGWKMVDLDGTAMTPRSFETPELATKYLPGPDDSHSTTDDPFERAKIDAEIAVVQEQQRLCAGGTEFDRLQGKFDCLQRRKNKLLEIDDR